MGKSWPTAVDLFCGSGAVTAALKRRRFRVVAAIDNDPIACSTYRLNHPTVDLLERDIRKVKPQDIRQKHLGRRNLDVLIVCAPCQPFSRQNRKRARDTRSELILEAGRFAKALKPRVIFFENVPGLAARDDLLARLKARLGRDYNISEPHSVDAADYGVPQRRVRCIMIATRKRTPPVLPSATTPAGKRRTVQQAIGRLAPLAAGEAHPRDRLHAARAHSSVALRRLAAIPQNGGSRSSLPKRLQLACHSSLDATKYSDVYGRMRWQDVAPTLTTGCTDITRGRFAHPRDDRAITLREASLLQTFPRRYRFFGSVGDISQQIGNAVPMKLIEAFIPTLRAAAIKAR